MIGIRLADHSVFSVFRSEAPGGQRVVLTTARDNQERVDIHLVQSNPDVGSWDIGTVTLDDLPPAHGGEVEIELVLRLTPDGQLEATATNRATGNSRSISIDIQRAVREAEFAVPQSLTDGFEPDLATEPEPEPRPRRSGGLLVIGMVLVIAALAAGSWWFFLRPSGEGTTTSRPEVPSSSPDLRDTSEQESAERSNGEPSPEPQNSPPVPAEEDRPPRTDEPPTTPVRNVDSDSVEYRIRRGDTLWDISDTFYGTPWLFSELADANEISNPNLIYAEGDLQIPDQLLRED
ncbi:MAG: LysM peptidoglycan-binding domain-containing protein [Alkalispirochaeta sp.]